MPTITLKQYQFFLSIGHAYEGYVEGLGYVKIGADPSAIQKYWEKSMNQQLHRVDNTYVHINSVSQFEISPQQQERVTLWHQILKVLAELDSKLEGKGGVQKSGLYLVSSTGGAMATKFKALYSPGDPINIDLLLGAIGGVGAGKYSPDAKLAIAEVLNKIKGIVEEAKEQTAENKKQEAIQIAEKQGKEILKVQTKVTAKGVNNATKKPISLQENKPKAQITNQSYKPIYDTIKKIDIAKDSTYILSIEEGSFFSVYNNSPMKKHPFTSLYCSGDTIRDATIVTERHTGSVIGNKTQLYPSKRKNPYANAKEYDEWYRSGNDDE